MPCLPKLCSFSVPEKKEMGKWGMGERGGGEEEQRRKMKRREGEGEMGKRVMGKMESGRDFCFILLIVLFCYHS